MKILRQTNPNISFALIPWFVPSSEQTILQIGAELYQKMIDIPDDTLVLTAMEGEYCKAIIIAYSEVNEQGKVQVYLWQARKLKDFKYPRLVFAKAVEWAKYKQATRLILGSEDKRVRRMYKRKYGFSPMGGNYMERAV